MAHRFCPAQRNHTYGTHDTDEVWSSHQAYPQNEGHLWLDAGRKLSKN